MEHCRREDEQDAGNVIDPFALIDKYGVEALRYYLMTDIVTGKDADFSEQRLVRAQQCGFANALGNLFNRTLNMLHRYRDGKLSAFATVEFADNSSFADLIKSTVEQYILTRSPVSRSMKSPRAHNASSKNVQS